MFFMNEALKLQNTKLQLNNLNIQFDTFIAQIQNGLIINIGMQIEDISLKLLNLGLEMLSVEILSNAITFFNSTQQIRNIGLMIQNLASQMTNLNSMKKDNLNILMPFQNNSLNNNVLDTPKLNINFDTSNGEKTEKTTLSLKYGTSIKEMIEKYFSEKQLEINYNRFTFIYQAEKINPNDTTPIENLFKNSLLPSVVVIAL